MAEPLERPALPCPECRQRGHEGRARIGNRRARCQTCNQFSQKVIRLTWRMIQDDHPEIYEQIRQRAEMQVYAGFVEDFIRRNPDISPS